MKDFLVGWIAALFGVIVGVLLMASECRAAPLTPKLNEYVYAVAYGQFTGPPEWLSMMPEVRAMTQDDLCDFAGYKTGCRVRAAYRPDQVRYLHTLDFDTLLATSILLHEFVHHFQWLKTGDVELIAAIKRNDIATVCDLWVADERQAYSIQAHVLEKDGAYLEARDVFKMRNSVRCPFTEQ